MLLGNTLNNTLMQFVEASLYPLVGGALVITTWTGLGYLVRRLAGAVEPCPISEALAVGVGALVLVGGLLNLASQITLPIVLGLEALGLIGLGIHRRPLWARMRAWLSDPGAFWVCVMFALFYLRSVTNAWFALSDDLNGYLQPVARIVQTGGLGRDPFLLERLTGGPGAYFFLESLFVLHFGYYQISLLQPAVGVLMVVGAAAGYLRRAGVRPVLVVATALAAYLSFARVDFLATAVVLQAGLLIVLALKLLSSPVRGVPDAVSCGLILGGAIAQKVLSIPFVGVLVFAWLASNLLGRRGERRELARFSGMAFAVALLAVVPWMISSYRSSGTALFPLLGSGYYAYGATAFPYDGRVLPYVVEFLLHYKRILLGILLAVGGVGIVYWATPPRTPADQLMLGIAVTALPLVLLIAVVMEATDFLRYAHATYGTVTMAGLVWACRKLHGLEWWSSPGHVTGGITVILMIGLLQSPHPYAFAVRSYANLAHLATGDADLSLRLESQLIPDPPAHAIALGDPAEQSALAKAQTSAPPGKTILVSLQRPYLLDLKRDEIWSVGNYGGSASPPPGFPIEGSGEEIRAYLRSVGVSYVLFQCAGDEPWFDHQLAVVASDTFSETPWNDDAVRVSVRFREALRRLLQPAVINFRDDRFVVISLGGP